MYWFICQEMKEGIPLSEFGLDEHLCFQLYQASRVMTRLYKEVLKPYQLTYPQYIVMVLLWEHDRLSFKEISDALHLKTGTLSPLLKRLEKDGWIKRKHNSNDDRMIEVYLSKKGLAYREEGILIPCETLKRLQYDQETYDFYLETAKKLSMHLHEIEKTN